MTDFKDLYDDALAKQVEEQEAEEAARETDQQSTRDLQVEASERALARDDNDASGLIGAQVGNLRVLRREKPGKRPLFVCHERRSDQEIRLQGYQLVRAVREARNAGLPVIGLREPWRDEQ